ncbi:hypothetical protein ACET3Z_028250 [Daucus carota]
MAATEKMAGMDNKLTVDKNLIEVFAEGVDADVVVLMAALASRTENQEAIDTVIVGMMADPKEIYTVADWGLWSLAVAYQEVPEGGKESAGGPWQFVGLY